MFKNKLSQNFNLSHQSYDLQLIMPTVSTISVTEVHCMLQRGELAVCTINGTRGQSIARLKLPVDIAKTQASFNNLFHITKYIQIIITISKQVPNKNNKVYKVQILKYKVNSQF